ncbi:MAG: hypothetical protein ACU836_04955 [Gammaproteobacteria bacterium]
MKVRNKIFLPVMALITSNSFAIDWLFEPEFHFKERYTDNLRMQVNPAHDDLITTISPGLLLGYQTENQELKSSFQWNELIYHNDSSLDFSEKIGDINHLFAGENFKTELSARYAEQSSINTQLDLNGTGDIQRLVPRTTRSISPGITYNLTERNALQLSFSYVDVAFGRDPEKTISRRYYDYDNRQISGTFIHSFSKRLSFNATIAYSKFNSGNDTSENASFVLPGLAINQTVTQNYQQQSTTLLYQGGLQYMFDEQTTFSFSAGMRDTESKTHFGQSVTYNPQVPPLFVDFIPAARDLSSTSNGHVFSASLARNSDWGGFSISAGQQLNPASTGSQQESTSFSGHLRYNLTERLATTINASYLKSDSVTNFTNANFRFNRTYATVTPSIRWNWTPEINLELSYTYRHQQYDHLDRTAESNNVQLQFSYQPQINRQVK